jgi:phage repressor protein C with HTH and peptisase S24 domain
MAKGQSTEKPASRASPSVSPSVEPDARTADPAETGRRIAELRGRETQEAFAAQLGVHVNTLGRYERGERLPDGELLFALSRVKGVSSDWVLFGLPPKGAAEASDDRARRLALARGYSAGLARDLRAREPEPEEGIVYVPLYDVAVGAGRGRLVPEEERIAAVRAFSAAWLSANFGASHDDVYLVSVMGESMSPLLNEGDVILVDKRDRVVRTDAIYVVRMGEALMVKNVQRLPHRMLRVWSENEKVAEPFNVDLTDGGAHPDFDIIGRVLWRGGTIRR